MHFQSLALVLAAGTTGPDLSRYFAAIGILIAVLLAVAYGIKRLAGYNGKLHGKKRGLAVVEVLSLGGRRQLAVVRCYDRTFALGLGEKDVSLVAELDAVHGAQIAEDSAQPATDTEVDPFEDLIERAQQRLGSSGDLERPPVTKVQELVK